MPTFVNTLFRPLTELLLRPFVGMPAIVGLAIVSLVFGVLALLIYKYISNQAAIARVKDQIAAGFFEIRLFNDDIGALMRAQGGLLKNNLKYMALNAWPLAVMSLLFLPFLAQLFHHYNFGGYSVGDQAVLVAEFDPTLSGDQIPVVSLELPQGLVAESPGVRSQSPAGIAWRIRAEEPGIYDAVLNVQRADGELEAVTKSFVVDQRVLLRSPLRKKPGLINQFLAPAEAALPSTSVIDEIKLDYPTIEIDSVISSFNWIWPFLVLSVVFAFALKNRLGVTL